MENKVALGSDVSRTTAAYTIWAVNSLLPSIYDYAGANNAANPALYDRAWSTNLFFSTENPLFNNLESLQEEFMRKLATALGTILKSLQTETLPPAGTRRTSPKRKTRVLLGARRCDIPLLTGRKELDTKG